MPEGLPGRAFVAETPIDDPGDDRRNVAMLWDLTGLKEQAPEAEKGFSMLTAALKKKLLTQRAQSSQGMKKSSKGKSGKSSQSKKTGRRAKESRRRG
jgi:hypothetical protein